MSNALSTPAVRLLAALAGVAIIAAPATAAPRMKVYTVTIHQMSFGPLPTNLHVGDTIEWVNNDVFVHSATASDKSFDVELHPKAHVKMVLKKAGTLAFACRYHPGMRGRLAVEK